MILINHKSISTWISLNGTLEKRKAMCEIFDRKQNRVYKARKSAEKPTKTMWRAYQTAYKSNRSILEQLLIYLTESYLGQTIFDSDQIV